MNIHPTFHQVARWILPVGALAVIVAAAAGYGRSGELYSGADSPYYNAAVKEAMRGLADPSPARNAQPAAAVQETVPPLPAPYNPADYYWCPQCKAYHLRAAAGSAHPR